MIRTVWLGLAFLVVLAGVSSFRFAFGAFDDAYALGIARPEDDRAAGATTVQETLTSADRSVAFVSSMPDIELAVADQRWAVSARTPPAIVTPRIANRHWQEPVTRQAKVQKPKRKPAKKDAIADQPQAAAEPKACQLEDFDAIRRAFNLPTGCHT